MASAKRNYLLGNGESLARNEAVKLGFGEGADPYTLGEAKAALAPQLTSAVKYIDTIPSEACPRDEAVLAVTLHPKYLSKSSYPGDLLKAVGLRTVGSKAVTVTPRKSHLKHAPVPAASAELYVAGPRKGLRDFAQGLSQWPESASEAADLIKIESIRVLSPEERVKPIHAKDRSILFEVVLYAGTSRSGRHVLKAFEDYVRSLDIDVDLDQRIDADDLSFIPLRVARNRITDVAKFSFLRLAREMPRLRELWPTHRRGLPANGFPCAFPVGEPLDPTIRVAVFDGGHPDVPALKKWVKRIDGVGVVGPAHEYLSHGLAVTSALLFGPLESGTTPPRPYARVDHYRVLDELTETEPQESLYPVLKRIVSVLEKEKYDFVNFSIGPGMPIDDDDVHPWTAKIDPLLATGRTLATVAVGNSGEQDAAAKLNRIQPPSDCVNAFSIGACDGNHGAWKRSTYSSVGHGRCPGIIKPDGVVFGGASGSPFWVVDYDDSARTRGVMGTSFASPAALRAAIGVRACLGPAIGSLALKALLIHNSHDNGHEKAEVGWGRLCTDVEELITCATGNAHVVYQGELDPKKFLRATVPMPEKPINGLVTITATICFASETDPQHPLTYTKSGLQIFFRKDRFNIKPGKMNPKSTGFFKTGLGLPEHLIRNDAHQWETVRHASKRMRGADLKNPCFDIHYNPRDEGHDTDGTKIPYAMIVTVSSPKVTDLFDQIFTRYRFQLSELKPQLELPVPIRRGT